MGAREDMRMQKLVVISLGALACLAASPAQADRGRNPLAGQPAIRQRVEMRKLRFEITPSLLLSANQPYLIGVGGGLSLQFHFNDWIGLAASFHYTAGVETPLTSKLADALPDKPDTVYRQPSKTQFRDHLVGPNLLAAVYGVVTPIGGKFALFNSLFARYDFYGMLGLGIASLTNPLSSGAAYQAEPSPMNNDVNNQASPFTGIRPGGMVGIGTHFFFNEWVGLNLEFRDYFYKSNPGGLDVVTSDRAPNQPAGRNQQVLTRDDEYLTNNLYFSLGVTFMLPPTAKVSR